MSREERKNSRVDKGGGLLSTFWKVAFVAVATIAIVVGYKYAAASSMMHPPETVWTKPIMGWVRFAHIQSPWFCGLAQKLKPNVEAEGIYKEVIFKGLELVMGKGLTKLVFEGIVYFVNNGKSFDPLISGIKELHNNRPWKVKLSWVRRKAKQVAHKLA